MTLIPDCIASIVAAGGAGEAQPVKPAALRRLSRAEPLPPTLSEFLKFDGSFKSVGVGRRFALRDAEPFGAPLSLDEVIRRCLRHRAGRPLETYRIVGLDEKSISASELSKILDASAARRLAKSKFYAMPYIGCGRQSFFLYVGQADDTGEFPILCMEPEGGELDDTTFLANHVQMWIEWPAFDIFLAELVELPGIKSKAQEQEILRRIKRLLQLNPELPPGPG